MVRIRTGLDYSKDVGMLTVSEIKEKLQKKIELLKKIDFAVYQKIETLNSIDEIDEIKKYIEVVNNL